MTYDRHSCLSWLSINKNWADLVLVWVPSEIKHRITTKYTQTRYNATTILIQRRGVEALFQETVGYLNSGKQRVG